MAYILTQQTLRQGANDPQIQMAEDTAAALTTGQTAFETLPLSVVNMRESLAPFLIVVDKKLNVVATRGQLDGKTALPPAGAFTAAANAPNHQNRITWQPAPGIREAAVIQAYNNGYVVAARSLGEVEAREDQAQNLAAAVLGVLVVVGVILFVVIK